MSTLEAVRTTQEVANRMNELFKAIQMGQSTGRTFC